MNFFKYNGEGICKLKKQSVGQLIDVTLWRKFNEIEAYAEGARAKEIITCPTNIPFPFLISNHKYLFKQSNKNFPAQFWVEAIAFRLGCLMDVPVPPAFIGFDRQYGTAGAVIEWFYDYPGESPEGYTRGGDLISTLIDNYDRKKGTQHNFMDIITIIEGLNLSKNWQVDWVRLFCFDALIGNTDRHQDNWGVIRSEEGDYFSPAFDNGTAMGHEILEPDLDKKLHSFDKYVLGNHARHRLKWDRNDHNRIKHFDFLQQLIIHYPNMKQHMQACLEFSKESIAQEIYGLLDLSNTLPEPYAKLTSNRANFIIKLTEYRLEKALEILT